MKYIFRGNLLGYLCDDCYEAIAGNKVLLYLPLDQERVTANAVADTKDTFHQVTEDELKKKEKLLIATAVTDEAGNFEFVLDEKHANSAFDVDFECGTVPHHIPGRKKIPFLQFHLTTVYPQWRTNEKEDAVYRFSYAIPAKWWCYTKGRYFDVWTICGILTDCKTGSPLPGVKVIAMDDDLITDDLLGSDVTDANGHFHIFYTSKQFKKTFLSPAFNVETDPSFPFFSSGPDVYFLLEYNGQKIAFETPANRRKNVGHCLCVKLCTEKIEIIEPSIPPSFTHLGLLRHVHIQSEINSANGKTSKPGFVGYAFHGSVNLIGTISKKIGGQPMEYMFEYQEVATPGTLPNPAAWSPVLPNMIDKTIIGYLWTLTGDPMNPIAYEPYYINGAGTEKTITYNGNWIPVPQEANFAAHVDAQILALNTVSLTGLSIVDMAMPTSGIGSPTVSGSRPEPPNRYFAIRMKQRQVNVGAGVVAGTSKPIAIFNTQYNNVNKFGSWAPTTYSNQIAAVSVDIQEIVSGASGCSKIIDALHVKYGARNENLSSISLSIVGPAKPGQSFGFAPIAAVVPETVGSAQLVFTPPTDTVNDLLACAYTVTLHATVALTNGEGEPGVISDFVSFCKV